MDQESEDMLEQGASVFTQGILMETQQAGQTFADIEARHADIMKLENFMREPRKMFLDMAMLVESQICWEVLPSHPPIITLMQLCYDSLGDSKE
ncbi:hypothetical protein QYM36_019899 [Artemia franciscana]|uniref:Uncharacterized protein n=3 Tax=Artemia franciscana TaxID=6661 RepID=A0AA88KSS2_ARTSF|nr:hypothetical protein QYM36_019899 [Artemia franciscana]